MTRQTVQAQHRIARLAACLPVHRAFHWLHLHQPQLRLWQLELLAIPAPPFHESARASWFLERFTQLGLTNPHIDAEGNALAELHPDPTEAPPTPGLPSNTPAQPAQPAPTRPTQPFLLLSAHLDTVFPPGTPTTPTEDGSRILAPGACDNAAGLTALLALAAALRFAAIRPPMPILFAANVGEEGEGNLRGMRHLFVHGPYSARSPETSGPQNHPGPLSPSTPPNTPRIVAALALEGSGTATAVTRALGSRRFRVTLSGPGGHSWSDAHLPNPITLLSRGLTALADLASLSSSEPRTTLSPGLIAGGTSINSIPTSASVLLDLRSTESAQLDLLALELHRTFETLVAHANRSVPNQPDPITLRIELIGSRPAATLPDDSPLLATLRAVDRHLGLRTELRLGSTDANLPLSLGIPAMALAAGGTGGGIHTLAEWYDPTGRETALRRLLLTLLDTAQSFQP